MKPPSSGWEVFFWPKDCFYQENSLQAKNLDSSLKGEKGMKIIPFADRFLEEKSSFFLGKRPVGITNSVFLIDSREKEKFVKISREIWKKLVQICPDFKGLIRYDLVPSFPEEKTEKISWRGMTGYDLGEIEITGVYELNDRSPECATAVSALHKAKPALQKFQPSAAFRLAEAIKKEFDGQEIVLLPGEGFVKQCWGDVFLYDLVKAGLNIRRMDVGEFMKKSNGGEIVYLYGDYRNSRGPSEYNKEGFTDFINDYPRSRIFNTIPMNGFISDKSNLFPNGDAGWNRIVGNNIILNEDAINFALENRKELVAKPFLGSSGKNVHIGRLLKPKDWRRIIVNKACRGGYGLFEAKWLPRIELPCGNFAIDINVAFWAAGKDLKYLYTISRIDYWDSYWHRGVINVAQGAGFAGTLREEDF